ncbi:MAG: glutaredoxin family protein [Steroidobacteraceae bacterium]|nr:glutaredoxin family protein [Steroidobacteraceae bacterium]MCC7197927.1 glutaredoxin family protein [Gammaproteobacteria bacterium]
MTATAPRLVIYSREDCHLCDVMVEDLAAFLAPRGLGFELRDVDADPATARRWGLKVPVLTLDGSTVCWGRLDEAKLAGLLAV